MIETKFFRSWLIFFMSNWSIFFLSWGDVKNPRFIACDDMWNYQITCVLHQKFLDWVGSPLFILISLAVWVHILRTLWRNPQRQECKVWSYRKLRCRVRLPTGSEFHKLQTFSHVRELWSPYVLFHQSKCRSVDYFFYCYDCFPTSPCEISVYVNVQYIQTSCSHCTHFVAACVWSTQKQSLPWENISQCILCICQIHN